MRQAGVADAAFEIISPATGATLPRPTGGRHALFPWIATLLLRLAKDLGHPPPTPPTELERCSVRFDPRFLHQSKHGIRKTDVSVGRPLRASLSPVNYSTTSRRRKPTTRRFVNHLFHCILCRDCRFPFVLFSPVDYERNHHRSCVHSSSTMSNLMSFIFLSVLALCANGASAFAPSLLASPSPLSSSSSSRLYEGNLEQIEFKIYPDGRVEETVRGVKGNNCHKVTEKINENLGKVIASEPTEEMYEQELVIDQTLSNTVGDSVNGDDTSWEGQSSW